MSFSQSTGMGPRTERLPPMIIVLLFVIPALISCSNVRNPEGSPVSEPTTVATPHETVAPPTLAPNDEILAECIQGDVAVHFHVQLTISI